MTGPHLSASGPESRHRQEGARWRGSVERVDGALAAALDRLRRAAGLADGEISRHFQAELGRVAETDRLIRALARARGVDPTEAMKLAVEAALAKS
jgi:hypothetical protein